MRLGLALLVLLPALAQAQGIGKVTSLKGTGRRATAEKAEALAVGAEIQVGDRIEVEQDSYLKVTLNDASVIALGPKSVLEITAAAFAGQTRETFAGTLWMGKLWAKVTKALAGSEAKFEVSTQRAVAGVRGTLFRVDAVLPKAAEAAPLAKVLARASRPSVERTMVRVMEGKVGVEAEIKKKPAAPPKGPRREVSGPQEISADEWEKKFAELQANQQVVIGESSFHQGTFDTKRKDAFDRFVDTP